MKSYIKPKKLRISVYGITLVLLISFPVFTTAGADNGRFNLSQTIETALEANLELQRSKDEIEAAAAAKSARGTEFFPTLNARYGYLKRDNPTTQAVGTLTGGIGEVLTNPEDEYNFVTSFSQPIFTGFALYNQYKIADLGLDIAEFTQKLTRQNVILDAKNAYYSILKTQKLAGVADETVKQIAAQKDVAENMYQVGMSPLNDLLQSQVQLANAKQALITAKNNLAVAKSQLHLTLQQII